MWAWTLIVAVARIPSGGPETCLPVELDRLAVPADPLPAPAPEPPPPPPPPLPAPLTRVEHARYRVVYGILGEVGEVTITLTPAAHASPTPSLVAVGQGRGSLLGLGQTDKRIESEIDARAVEARRWTTTRSQGGKTVTDVARQSPAGTVALVRRRAGKPDETGTLLRKAAVLDPLGFLVALRVTPPATARTFEVLDGRGLWLMKMAAAARVASPTATSLRLDGRAEPVYWDGDPDPERTARDFTLWLADDAFRTPLRLILPFGPGNVDVALVALSRPTPPLTPIAGTRTARRAHGALTDGQSAWSPLAR